MRVLNVLFEERLGGPQLRVLQVAIGLRRLNIETTVAIPQGDPLYAQMLKAAEVPFVELPLVRLGRTYLRGRHLRFPHEYFSSIWALRRLIHQGDFTLVHTNGLSNLQAAVAARLEHVPLVWHLNDVSTPRWFRAAFLPLACAWSQAIAAASQGAADFYFPDVSTRPSCLRIVYPPVNPALFCRSAERRAVRDELGIAATAPVIATVANVNPSKGIDVLIEAASVVSRQFPACTFLVAGELLSSRGDYWQPLLKRVAERGLEGTVHFLGRRNDIPRLLSACDVYLHPSVEEAAPMAVLEASASGLPVVATDVGGVSELVLEGVTGYVVPPRAADQVADAIIRLLREPEIAAEMGRVGSRRAAELFSIDRCVQQHFDLYRTAIN